MATRSPDPHRLPRTPMLNSDGHALRIPVDDLRRVASYQRWVIACVLTQITMWLGLLVIATVDGANVLDGARVGTDLPRFLTWLLGVGGGMYAFLIYWSLGSPVRAVLMGLACVPPLLGLLALTAVNGAATRALNDSGVKVGLFGADLNEIREGSVFYDDEDAGW
jgi:hypothetical protein